VTIQLPIVACGLLLLAFPLNAATLYVDKDPTCHGLASCFATIQAAVDAAAGGDTVSIAANIYFEHVVITGKNNSDVATESNRIVITGDDVTIAGTGSNCDDGSAIRIRRSKFITVRGLTFTGSVGAAIDVSGGGNRSTAVYIERNRIFENGTAGCDGGIVIGSGNLDTLIVNNLIYSNARNGLEIASGGGPHYIIGNTIDANNWNGIDIAERGSVFLVNNIITHNGSSDGVSGGRSGIRRNGRARQNGVHLFNNLICGNRQGEIVGRLSADGQSGNLTPSGSEGAGFNASPGCENNIFNGLDFNLGPHSPAIDAGFDPRTIGLNVLLNPILEFDFFDDGFRRPQDGLGSGAAFDIGAIEALNLGPKAGGGNATTRENTPLLVSLQGRALEPATLAASVVSGPSHGSLGAVDLFFCAIGDNFDRRIAFDICSWTTTYTPDPNFIGTDSFTYKISANGTDSPSATITIQVAEPQS
jgi:Right handed beta helix region/Bacterial Ig domain